MMKYVVCKQERPLKGKILSVLILCFSVVFLFMNVEPIETRMIFFLIASLIFGFSKSYRINADFNNQKFFSVFGLNIFTTKLQLLYPDYISVFSASFGLDNEWGAIAAIGTKEKHNQFVVRFFKNNQNNTVFRTNTYDEAIEKAYELKELLKVEIHDATKE